MDGTLTIRVDSNTKAKAKLILNDLGLDLSTAINMYLKQIIKKGGIPFMIQEPSEHLKQALKELDDPSCYSKGYDDVDEMINDVLNNNVKRS